MASTADSKPAFRSRLEELELQELLPKFEKLGWLTFGDFGFACHEGPGCTQEVFQKTVLTPLVGDSSPLSARIRRLFAQSYAIAAADTERYLSVDPEKPVALHPAEREDRRAKLAEQLTGFKLEGTSDPSFRLIDRCAAVLARGEVKYLQWEKCTPRSSELQDIAEDKQLKPDKDGFIQLQARDVDLCCDISSDMLLGLALRRRALACEIAGLITYDAMNTWHERLFAEYLRDPLPGFSRVSLAQLRRADAEVFRLTGEACRNGTRRRPGETQTEFEKAFVAASSSFPVQFLLQPLQRGSGSASSSSGPPSREHRGSNEQRLQNQVANLRSQLDALKKRPADGGKGKGGDKKRRGTKGKGGNFPEELRNKNTKTSKGEPICFNFNLPVGCALASPGQRCPKGWHVTMDERR